MRTAQHKTLNVAHEIVNYLMLHCVKCRECLVEGGKSDSPGVPKPCREPTGGALLRATAGAIRRPGHRLLPGPLRAGA
eukprot:1189043-Prorocentrum_minimum.AAC.2